MNALAEKRRTPPPAASVAAAADGGLLHIPPEAHTLPGFRAWALSDDVPEKLPMAFIQGQIYLDMSKEEIQTHAAVKAEIGITLGALVRDLDLGNIYINGVLVTNVEAEVSNNPDMVAILWESVESGKVRYVATAAEREMEIEGSPDWLLEIVSTSSVVKDTQLLRQAYHRAGVREYWIVDARGDDIRFQILHWRKTGYAAAPRTQGGQRSRVFARSFDLTRTRDRRGGWRYALGIQ